MRIKDLLAEVDARVGGIDLATSMKSTRTQRNEHCFGLLPEELRKCWVVLKQMEAEVRSHDPEREGFKAYGDMAPGQVPPEVVARAREFVMRRRRIKRLWDLFWDDVTEVFPAAIGCTMDIRDDWGVVCIVSGNSVITLAAYPGQ